MVIFNYKEGANYASDVLVNANLKAIEENLYGTKHQLNQFKDVYLEPFSFEELNFYSNILSEDMTEIVFDERYRYKPQYVSYDYYNTTRLTNVILFFNKIFHPCDFEYGKTNNKIFIPKIENIMKVAAFMMSERQIVGFDIRKMQIGEITRNQDLYSKLEREEESKFSSFECDTHISCNDILEC